jgi:hypothetical protein
MMMENKRGNRPAMPRFEAHPPPSYSLGPEAGRVSPAAPRMSLDEVHSFSYPGGGFTQASQEVAESAQRDPIRSGNGFLN